MPVFFLSQSESASQPELNYTIIDILICTGIAKTNLFSSYVWSLIWMITNL